MRKPHTSDTVVGTAILLICGIGLTILTRMWGIQPNYMSQMAAFVGPVAITLGIGMAIYGGAMPTDRITLTTRVWGLLGSAVTLAHVWSMGYFDASSAGRRLGAWLFPIVLVVAWLLPARFYSGGNSPPSEPADDAPPPQSLYPQ
jgi:hypothetical protein